MNWKPSEKKFIYENYKTMTVRDMAKKIGRAHSTVSMWMSYWGLSKQKIPPKIEPKPKKEVLQWKKGRDLQNIWR